MFPRNNKEHCTYLSGGAVASYCSVLAFGKQKVESCLTKNYDKTHVMNMNMNQPVCCFQQSCNIVAVST